MSFAGSSGLQAAVYTALIGDAALTALVGSDIYDALPSGAVPELYVSLGPEDAIDASSKTGAGARHDFTVSVVTDASGFQAAKDVASAICDVLLDADLPLTRGSLVGLWFLKAKAARAGDSDVRRIDLTFRARIDGV
ncbi:MAG: DUF3168 domain-containing protein [Pseudomonadota bacterium]